MSDYDAVIIGSGPAGLAAGIYLARAKRQVILLDMESFGGYIKNIEWIENYPGFSEGVSGAELASQMVTQATKYGLQFKLTRVTGIENFSSSRWVACENGEGFNTKVVIIAGGSCLKKLGVPGEEILQGKGVFHCALCDGGEFTDQVVAVCGGGDAGVTEALYMTKLASKVHLVELLPKLTASAILQERVAANPKIEVHCGTRVEAIVGNDHVEGISVSMKSSGKTEVLPVDGVLVHIGLDPNTQYLEDSVPLDNHGQIIVNSQMETEVPCIFAAGDIRSGSPRQIVTAVGDGAIAAIQAERLLQTL